MLPLHVTRAAASSAFVSQRFPVQPSSHLHVPVSPPQRPWYEHVAKLHVMLQPAEYEFALHGRQSGPVKPHGQPQATFLLPLPSEPDPTPDPVPSEPMSPEFACVGIASAIVLMRSR